MRPALITPRAGQFNQRITAWSSGEFPISVVISRSHARLAGITVDSASDDFPQNWARFSFMKAETHSQALVWHSFRGEVGEMSTDMGISPN